MYSRLLENVPQEEHKRSQPGRRQWDPVNSKRNCRSTATQECYRISSPTGIMRTRAPGWKILEYKKELIGKIQ